MLRLYLCAHTRTHSVLLRWAGVAFTLPPLPDEALLPLVQALTEKALMNDGTGNRFPVTLEISRAVLAVRDFARAAVKASHGVGTEAVGQWYKWVSRSRRGNAAGALTPACAARV